MPQRLKRLDAVFVRWPIYFVTACTAKRRHLLANNAAHQTFEEFAKDADHGAWVGRYVLMPDHLHLFVAIDDRDINLSRWMKSLKGTLSSHFRSTGALPPYWQKGFFDHVMRSGDSYSAKWEYVRNNPVRGGLVKRWEDWPFAGEIQDLEFVRERG